MRAWPRVESCLRTQIPTFDAAPDALRNGGLFHEALALEIGHSLEWGAEMVLQGQCLTASHRLYPQKWLRTLGSQAPPAFSRAGEGPPQRIVAIYAEPGLHVPNPDLLRSLHDAGYAWTGLVPETLGPLSIVSKPSHPASREVWTLPAARFPAVARSLEFAAAEYAIVAGVHFRTGPVWTAAVDALRRRLAPVFVTAPLTPASKALIALGAKPYSP